MRTKSIVGACIGLTVVVVLVATLLYPAIDNYTHPSPPGWVYDDYVLASEGDTVTGSFELVEYDGVNYIHAKDVGSGTINGEEYTVSKADLTVFLLWGQSNAMYLNADVDEVNAAFDPIKTRAYFYGIDTDSDYRPIISWKSGSTAVYPEHGSFLPVCSPDGKYLIGNVEAPFCAGYCENSENYRPYIINAAVGGMNIQAFLPGTIYNTNTHNIWDEAISKIDSTKFNVHYAGWIMSQGEANAGTSIPTYIEYFDTVVGDIESSFDLDYGAIIQTRSGNSLNANEAQTEIVKTHRNIIMGSTASNGFTIENGCLSSSDGIHYTQLGDNIVGYETAEAWLKFTEPASFDLNLLSAIIPIVLIASVVSFAIIMLGKRD
jgi:hypothetical protein